MNTSGYNACMGEILAARLAKPAGYGTFTVYFDRDKLDAICDKYGRDLYVECLKAAEASVEQLTEDERLNLAKNTLESIMRLLPPSPAHIWQDGDEILADSKQAAEGIADLIDAIYGDMVTNTGYYDPAEDARNGEVAQNTGYYYVNVD